MARLRGNPNAPYDKLFALANNARRYQDGEVYLNIAFYLGQQYAEYLTLRDGTGKLQIETQPDIPQEQQVPRPVINKIMHFVNEQLAMAMQSKPVADVLPANDDPLALGDAAVANAYVQWLQEPNVVNWEGVLWDANLWALVANQAYIKWVYSAALKRPDIQFCPSTDVYVDPYATDFYKARWIIHSQFLDPEQVYDVYGVDVKTSKVERADLDKTKLLRQMGQSPVMEGVTVKELWMLPSRRHPEGVFRVWSGNEVLVDNRPYPYDHGQLPFTEIGAIPRPNSQHYASPVSFMRAPQAELNYYHAQRIMTRKAWALLKLWLPDEVQLDAPWNDAPFQVLRGGSQNGAAPQVIGPPGAMPDNQDGEWLNAEMGHVIGIHPVSEGQVPGRVEAAKAIELLRESDTSRLAILLATTGTAISRGWWQALMLAKQYHQEEIAVEAYSNEGVAEVKRFFAHQFKPGMRIRVAQGSGLAFSRASRLDQLNTLWVNGVLRDPESFAQLADIPIPSIITTKAYDVRLARNENLTLAGGQAIVANSWDDHTIHLREHNNHRKTSDFASLNSDAKLRFEHHVSEHKDLEMAQLQEDAKKAMLLQQSMGAPPPGAGPGQNSGGQQDPANFYKAAAVGPGTVQ